MRHSDDQRVYRVYGSWVAENFQNQVSILNQKLSEFAHP
ncbi:lambdoid prophage defective integrase [Escherichia coli PA22]|nr:lambdoid prophage defective integrase [Escherichia coli PA22]